MMMEILLVFNILLIFAAVGLAYRMKQKCKPASKSVRVLLEEALSAVGCSAKWRDGMAEDNKRPLCEFTYQGGYFSVMESGKEERLELAFLFFMDEPQPRLRFIQQFLNTLNTNSPLVRMVYSLNKIGNRVDVHIFAPLVLTESNAESELKFALEQVFLWRNEFMMQYFRYVTEWERNHGTNEFELSDEYKLALLREYEMKWQDAQFDATDEAVVDKGVSVRVLLRTLCGIMAFLPKSLQVVVGTSVENIPADEISEYDVSRSVVGESDFKAASALLYLTFLDKRNPEEERRLVLQVQGEGQTKDTLYYRVSVMLVPAAMGNKEGLLYQAEKVYPCSVLLAYRLEDNEQIRAKAAYYWKEALDKQEKGVVLSPEEEYLSVATDQKAVYHLYMGKQTFTEECYLECIWHLERFFAMLAERGTLMFEDETTVNPNLEDEVFMLGMSYLYLGRKEDAYFYLQTLHFGGKMEYIKSYVMLLLALNDGRTLPGINRIRRMNDYGDPRLKTKETEELRELLQRCTVSYYMLNREYGQAENILNQFLHNPRLKDFATKQLEELKLLKRKNISS